MDKHGDVYMFPDPYFFQMPPKMYTGVGIRAYSTMVPGLKWVDLVAALHGVEQVMWQRALYKEAFLKMFDEPSGVEMGVVDLYRTPKVGLAGPT